MKIVKIIQEDEENFLIQMSNGDEIYCYDNDEEMCIACNISPDWDFIQMMGAGQALIVAAHLWKDLNEKFPNFEPRDIFAEADDGEWCMYFYMTYEQWEHIYNTYRDENK